MENPSLRWSQLLGKPMSLSLELPSPRLFRHRRAPSGQARSSPALSSRPWPWLLVLPQDCRIFRAYGDHQMGVPRPQAPISGMPPLPRMGSACSAMRPTLRTVNTAGIVRCRTSLGFRRRQKRPLCELLRRLAHLGWYTWRAVLPADPQPIKPDPSSTGRWRRVQPSSATTLNGYDWRLARLEVRFKHRQPRGGRPSILLT